VGLPTGRANCLNATKGASLIRSGGPFSPYDPQLRPPPHLIALFLTLVDRSRDIDSDLRGLSDAAILRLLKRLQVIANLSTVE